TLSVKRYTAQCSNLRQASWHAKNAIFTSAAQEPTANSYGPMRDYGIERRLYWNVCWGSQVGERVIVSPKVRYWAVDRCPDQSPSKVSDVEHQQCNHTRGLQKDVPEKRKEQEKSGDIATSVVKK
ncbi:hypothetical protein ACJJTC_009541, partial [Scirpophaga incertulas]